MTEIGPEIRPAPMPETEGKKELIKPGELPLQTSLMLDGLKPEQGKEAEQEQQIDGLKSKVASGKLETTKIDNGSKLERKTYWKEHGWDEDKKREKTKDEKKQEWINSANAIFKAFRQLPDQKRILEKLGVTKDDDAEKFYNTFFIEKEGSIGLFGIEAGGKLDKDDIIVAQDAVLTVEEEDPQTHEKSKKQISLFDALGTFYGKSSIEITKRITEGVYNYKHNPEESAQKAKEQFKKGFGADENKILEGISERSAKWEEEVKKDEAERKIQEQDAEEKRKADVKAEEERIARERAEEEAKKAKPDESTTTPEKPLTPEEVSKEIEKLTERNKDIGPELVKSFIPLLNEIKLKPDTVSEDVYTAIAQLSILTFKTIEYEARDSAEKQVENLIRLFDGFIFAHNSVTEEKDKNYLLEKWSLLNTIMLKNGIQAFKFEKDFDENTMEAVDTPVDDEDQKDKYLKPLNFGFKFNGKVVRKAQVAKGVPKKTTTS